MTERRCVWLTRDQRDALDDYHEFNEDIVQAWDAAPADPVEALMISHAKTLHVSNPRLIAEAHAASLGWEKP